MQKNKLELREIIWEWTGACKNSCTYCGSKEVWNEEIDEDRIKSLNEILDSCEYSRFSPSASGTEATTIYEGASQFIKSVENSIG